MIASQACSRFVSFTSMMEIFHTTISADLLTTKAVEVKWINCHVKETSFRWWELCDTVCFPTGSSNQKVGCCNVHVKGWTYSIKKILQPFNNAQLALRGSKCQEKMPHTIRPTITALATNKRLNFLFVCWNCKLSTQFSVLTGLIHLFLQCISYGLKPNHIPYETFYLKKKKCSLTSGSGCCSLSGVWVVWNVRTV